MSGKIRRIQRKDTLEFIKLLKKWRLVRVTRDIDWNFLILQNFIAYIVDRNCKDIRSSLNPSAEQVCSSCNVSDR
jgi:hypothetical protein